jgi:hypothetical protein
MANEPPHRAVTRSFDISERRLSEWSILEVRKMIELNHLQDFLFLERLQRYDRLLKVRKSFRSLHHIPRSKRRPPSSMFPRLDTLDTSIP